MKREAKMFGIVSKSGQIWTGSEYTSEEAAWEAAFGCEDKADIDHMKSKGCRCAVMTVTWEEPER